MTSLMRLGLLTAGILSVACTESLGPPRGANDIGAPLFSFSASGITLHTDNGALGYTGRLVRKGFDRRDANNRIIHPNPGDAIVATFYWLNPSGSTGNIIDSVRDVYTDATFTPIGNTYHLVDFITAGGISMATYAATAVHFDSTSGYVFAVEADFRDSIPDGGVKMTAWTGVEDVFANALGSFHSASVSASTPTPVAPGPMTIGPGSMAYGVTLSNGGVNMGSRPAGWTIVGGGIGSDGQLQDDGDYYRSPGGETINPEWTWDFQHASTAVLTVLELKPGTGSSTGNLTVNASTSGSSLDPDGYTVTVDGGSEQAIGINGSVSYTNLPSGGHTVAISGVATNCSVSGGTSQSVTVPSGGTATAAFSVSCTASSGSLTVTTSTSGSSLDPNGYTVTVDGGSSQAIGINSSVTFTNLPPGSHGVVLSGVATNCTVSGGTSRTVDVPSGGTSTVSYAVSCTTPNSPPVVNAGPDQTAITGLLYSFSWSFSDANNNGPWSYTVDWGDGSRSTGTVSSQGTYSAGHTYIILLPRSFTIRVTVTDAAGASASDTKVVNVLLL